MADELCCLLAVEAIDRFKARTLSPVELMQADIARAAEARYMKSDGRRRALEGIPVAIKDETAIKGERTTFASLIFRDNIHAKDSGVVERLKHAGAIFHARPWLHAPEHRPKL